MRVVQQVQQCTASSEAGNRKPEQSTPAMPQSIRASTLWLNSASEACCDLSLGSCPAGGAGTSHLFPLTARYHPGMAQHPLIPTWLKLGRQDASVREAITPPFTAKSFRECETDHEL